MQLLWQYKYLRGNIRDNKNGKTQKHSEVSHLINKKPAGYAHKLKIKSIMKSLIDEKVKLNTFFLHTSTPLSRSRICGPLGAPPNTQVERIFDEAP